MTEKNIFDVLSEVQSKINVPKSKYNAFGKYHYRSVEDIFDAIKKLQQEIKFSVSVTDEVVNVGERFYVKATAKFRYKDNYIEATGLARESLDKKGMDAAQITGAASSYARKYALSGLLLLDDNQDPDEQPPEPKKDNGKNNIPKKDEWTEKRKQSFVDNTIKALKRRGVPDIEIDKIFKLVCELHGYKRPEDVNNPEDATKIYKSALTVKVEDLKEGKDEKNSKG